MKLDGLPSKVMPPPDMALTFDLLTQIQWKDPCTARSGASRMLRGLMLRDLALLLVNRLKKNTFLVNVPLKWLPPEAFFSPNALNIVWRPGSAQTPWGELTTLPIPLAGFKRRTSKGRGGEERERTGGEMRGTGRERRKEWGGKVKYASLALGGWTPLIMVTKAAENGVARPKRPRPYRTKSSANAEGPREHTVS